jgi:crotonobetainyl-CoA:carnitine CoA-transferase CaiB-like acyl-CoA transferase
MNAKTAPRPLAGIKVLDFSTLLPGPMAGLILAEAGAEVIKIERPGTGEEMRQYVPRWGKEAVGFAMLNRGKKSLAINLKDRSALKLLPPLLEEADVLLEQFRPGVMERLGLGYDAVAKVNPKIIYCSITGYGATGPKAMVAGHDLNYVGDTGLLALSMGPDETPVVPPALIADLAGGTYPAVVNILLALLQRNQTGQGTHLDIAMTDNMFMLGYWALAQGLTTGKWPENGRALLTGGSPRYKIYPTKDGKFLAVAALEQKFWERFCDVIDLPQEFRDDREDPAATIEAVRQIVASRIAGVWRREFYAADCCVSVVQSLEAAFEDEHFRARGLFDHRIVNDEGSELPAIAVPVAPQFRGDPETPKAAPSLGANNDEFFKRG